MFTVLPQALNQQLEAKQYHRKPHSNIEILRKCIKNHVNYFKNTATFSSGGGGLKMRKRDCKGPSGSLVFCSIINPM
jgi:hypothetical protein